jgi:hypothetical protein
VDFTPLPSLPAQVSFTGVDPTPATDAGAAAALRGYYEAFNRHDADAVAAFCDPEIKWYSIDGDKLSTDAGNREQLTGWLVGYFKSLPTVRSEILALEQAGPFICVRERPSWTNKAGKTVSQQALGIYEVREGKIRRVWYFPSSE